LSASDISTATGLAPASLASALRERSSAEAAFVAGSRSRLELRSER